MSIGKELPLIKTAKSPIRNKILLTLALLIGYKILSHVPVPWVDTAALSILSSYSLFAFANEFNGGALSSLSLTAVGISSYITASIIIQLLSTGFKKLEDISKMPGGQKIIKKMTIILGVILSLATSYGLISAIDSQAELLTNDSWYVKPIIAVVHCIGSIIAIWVGETITEKGFGNGVSLLIAMNIASSLPTKIAETTTLNTNALVIVTTITCLVLFLVIILEKSEARIPIKYSKTVKMSTSHFNEPYLPMKINISGVMPIIFASTIFQLLSMVISLFSLTPPKIITDIITYGTIPYMASMVVIVFIFTFFYSYLIFRPDEIAKALQNNEGMIVGVRPGTETENYLVKLMNKLNLIGSIYMSVIVLIPILCFKFIGYIGLQPTSVIILAGVALEIIQKVRIEYLSKKCVSPKSAALLKYAAGDT